MKSSRCLFSVSLACCVVLRFLFLRSTLLLFVCSRKLSIYLYRFAVSAFIECKFYAHSHRYFICSSITLITCVISWPPNEWKKYYAPKMCMHAYIYHWEFSIVVDGSDEPYIDFPLQCSIQDTYIKCIPTIERTFSALPSSSNSSSNNNSHS